jgi:hypothetical protein
MSTIDITKSSRHQKIIGDYGEHLVCNWLSRSGFEVTIVDHTGIDIIAYDPTNKKRLGISVKSRTRSIGNEDSDVRIFSYEKEKEDDRIKKVHAACEAFDSEPWIAVYVETRDYADVYMISLENYLKKYCGRDGKPRTWKMKPLYKEKYENDQDIIHIRYNFLVTNWWIR